MRKFKHITFNFPSWVGEHEKDNTNFVSQLPILKQNFGSLRQFFLKENFELLLPLCKQNCGSLLSFCKQNSYPKHFGQTLEALLVFFLVVCLGYTLALTTKDWSEYSDAAVIVSCMWYFRDISHIQKIMNVQVEKVDHYKVHLVTYSNLCLAIAQTDPGPVIHTPQKCLNLMQPWSIWALLES